MRLFATVLFLMAGCSPLPPFSCSSNDGCVSGTARGQCSPGGDGNSYCAFNDPTCPSSLRWDQSAAEGLAGVCIADNGARKQTGRACAPTVGGASSCAGQICLQLNPNQQHEQGICSRECGGNSDCGGGDICVDIGQPKHYCFQHCQSNSQCMDGFICFEYMPGVSGCFVMN